MCRFLLCWKKIQPIQEPTETFDDSSILESSLIDLKTILFKILIQDLPMKSTELHKKFSRVCGEKKHDLGKKLSQSTNSYKILQFFDIKAKALEVALRYLNDRKSLEVVYDAKKTLISEYYEGRITKTVLVKKYFIRVKGTYQLEGYSQLAEIIKLRNRDRMFEQARVEYLKEIDILNHFFEKFDLKSLIEMNSSDEASKTNIEVGHKSLFSFSGEFTQ